MLQFFLLGGDTHLSLANFLLVCFFFCKFIIESVGPFVDLISIFNDKFVNFLHGDVLDKTKH
jgi:hypothetical protein